ncbi:TonB-dependent receptor [Sphingobacteriaceae bacterium WQ 2009]|uniref:TonB-dependent receptor n=1 Tax=Rhinopithecimicrobium faecis TaxID=2820698 RepID=A0A8T4HFB8_9SPHI|nr:TonB-dependent receptor [Sphingobacteriaceae bacterium WQ 2009]
MRKFLLLLCLSICSISTVVMAQQRMLEGKVTDLMSQSPLAGASIVVKETNSGASSDATGTFKISVANGQTLVFTYMGAETKEIPVTASLTTVNVQMLVSGTNLDEVVVVGYGSQKRANITGAVTTVDVSKTLENRPVTDAGRALQGAVSGLTISTASGDLGGDPTIRLRGVSGSIATAGGAAPLILVDGVEVPSLSMINPSDIESMSVIKDASAAIYGARAAWGVVLVKTKTGKRNTKTTINYQGNYALQTPTTTPQVAGGAEGALAGLLAIQRTNPTQMGYENLGIRYDQYAIEKMAEWQKLYGGQDLSNEMVAGRDYEVKDGYLYFHRTFDAEEMFMKKLTPQQNHTLGINGGSEKINYNIGLGYMNQSGVLKVNPDGYKRYNLSVGVNAELSKWLTGYAKVLYSSSDVTKPFSYNGSVYEPFFYLYRWQANYPYGTIDGKGMRGAINDVEQANMNLIRNSMARFTLGGQAKILPGLTLDADYTYTTSNIKNNENGGSAAGWDFWGKTKFDYLTYTGAAYNYVQNARDFTDRHVGNMFATYQKSVGSHNFKGMAGMNVEIFKNDYISAKRLGLLDQNLPQLGLATGAQTVASRASQWSTVGFFGRVNYDYQDKYLVEVLARYDGSSKFNDANKWGFFPAASVGYVISKEDYMDWAKPYLSFLKVRASAGSVGNQTVSANSFLALMNSSASNWLIDGVNSNTFTTPSVVSKDLTWETVTTKEIGVDASFFDNKFNVTYNRYRRTVSDLITGGRILPGSYGATSPLRNFGEMQTNGWELELAFNHQFQSGLSMRLSGQLSDYTESITQFDGASLVYTDGTSSNYKGKKIGEIWGYETDRLFQASDFTQNAAGKYILNDGIPSQAYYETNAFTFGPGDVKYKDLNGDGVIGVGDGTVQNPGDRKVVGNSTPRYQYGFRADFAYKGFDLGIFIQGVGQRDIWAGGDLAIPGWRPAEAWYEHQMDYWTASNTEAFYYRPTNQNQSNATLNAMPQSRYLLDMSYIRLKNLTFGYAFGEKFLERSKLAKLRVFFSGENLFEIDNLIVPIDPETDYTASGANDKNSFGRAYPYRRTFSLGLQLTF